MQWTDFGPYVQPFAIGCPEPVLIHHVRLAALEWCRKTLCWTEWLDTVLTDDTSVVEIDPGNGRQIVKIKTVWVDGKEWGLADTQYGQHLNISQDWSSQYCYTEDNKTLNIFPVQPAGTEVKIRAALMPTRSASMFDDALAEHIQDIAEGAIATLQRLPRQEFTNLNDSAIHESAFRDRINTIQMKVGRGLLAAKLTRAPRFI